MSKSSRTLQFASFVFDLSIEETLGALVHGGCICIPSDIDRLNDLAGSIDRFQITWTAITPTVLRTITPAQVPSLLTVVSNGEILSDDLVDLWAPALNLLNGYGPSEATIAATTTDRCHVRDRGSNIGKGRSCRIWLVDPFNDSRLAPVGAVGEIVVEGRQVGRGYVNLPEKTAAAFLREPRWAPSGTTAQNRFYKSGDLARLDRDGNLHYLGRKDQQVKIRGQRVELAEVECHIAMHSTVKVAVAGVPRNGHLKDRLVALVVLHSDFDSSKDGLSVAELSLGGSEIHDLLASLEHRLPRHMVPSVVIPIHSVPLLVSGKVNRRLMTTWLDSVDRDLSEKMLSSSAKHLHDNPTHERQSTIRDVWSEILNLSASQIGVNVSFFRLGGDSILALQMCSRLRERGIRVTVQQIFKVKTIAQLSIATEASFDPFSEAPRRMDSPFSDEVDIKSCFLATSGEFYSADDIETCSPCSNVQDTMLSANDEDPRTWNASFLFEVTGITSRVDVKKLQQAWITVVQQHAILRSVIFPMGPASGSRFAQAVLRKVEPWILLDSTELDALPELSNNESQCPAHLTSHQMKLISTSSGHVYCTLQMNHALYDAVSLAILVRDLRLAYDGVSLGPSTSYTRHVQQTIDLKSNTASVAYWKDLLHGCETIPLAPILQHDGHSDLYVQPSMHTITSLLPDPEKVYIYIQDRGLTLPNLFQCVWALCLRSIWGIDDIVFGNMVSSRPLATLEMAETVGPFVDILPCRVRFDMLDSIDSLHDSLQEGMADALSHQPAYNHRDMGFRDNVPLFETYLNVRQERHTLQNCHSSISLAEVDSYMYDQYQVVLYVDETESGINLSLAHQWPVVADSGAARLMELILKTVTVLVGTGDRTLRGRGSIGALREHV